MLDDWESDSAPSREQGGNEFRRGMPTPDDDEVFDPPAPSPGRKSEASKLITVDILERNPARGHGTVTSVAAGNNVLLVGTSRGWLVRYDFTSDETTEMDLSVLRTGEQWVHRVFIDPSGHHALATLQTSGGGSEVYYLHAGWKRAKVLPKLKMAVVNAVGWHRQLISETSTRDIVVGTLSGQLLELVVDEKDKRERSVQLLHQLTDPEQPICGLQMETVGAGPSTRYIIMAATPTRLYVFSGTGSLEASFALNIGGAPKFTELPSTFPSSELHLFGKRGRRAERFAWLAGPGLYHGLLNLSGQPSTMGSGIAMDATYEAKWLLEWSKLTAGPASDARPVSVGISEWHFLLLYPRHIKVVNRVSQEQVEEEFFGARHELGNSRLLGLASDTEAAVYYAFSDSIIYEITPHEEGRNMWRVFLSRNDYAAALSHCRNTVQRDQVYLAQAEAAFAAAAYEGAASFYAKIKYATTFEEVALKFVGVGEQDGLRLYLLYKLDQLGKEERSQLTMIATWATELYLDKINRLLLEKQREHGQASNAAVSNGQDGGYEATVREFCAFLSDCNGILDEATTVTLLASYGREEELVHFAELREQHQTVIQHYIRKGDASKALKVLRRPAVSIELQYMFAPALMLLNASETVDAWMAAGSNLTPRRLIPAIMRYAKSVQPGEPAAEAIRYLEYCVQRLQSQDSAVHNLLVALYAQLPSQSALLRFLSTRMKGSLPGVFYDPKYALRVCLEGRQLRACVAIYSLLEMHNEAVALALQIDLELAKAEAGKAEDDPDLRKKLWLMIARHVIQQEGPTNQGDNIRKAIAFLSETDGLLTIEDILPLFPDFVLIDDFKEAICSSLEDYNGKIEELKREMKETTGGADEIRRDISELSQRYAVVRQGELCGICRQPLLAPAGTRSTQRSMSGQMAPFYVFPCEHAFHTECLTQHVLEHADAGQREQVMDLKRRLVKSVEGEQSPSGGSAKSLFEVVSKLLDDAVAKECPFCGEMIIRSIVEPIVTADDPELVSWRIRNNLVAPV